MIAPMVGGAAACDITNALGSDIQGATVGGKAESVRDPLEANVLYLSDGGTALLLVSCDFGGLEPKWTRVAREVMAEACGLPERNILIGSTHTGGPSIIPTNYLKAVDERYLGRLVGWLAAVAQQAVNNAVPVVLRIGQGRAKIGYNRRCCWADGSHTMFGDTTREDFAGLEGPDDPTHTVIGVENALSGGLLAVVHANTGHPCTFYGADFYSADFPGTARHYLREVLGGIPVLFFNGAQGDICTNDITVEGHRSEPAELQLARLGHLLAGETLRLLHESPLARGILLKHVYEDVVTPVQLPSREMLDLAAGVLARVDAGEKIDGMEMARAHGAVLLQARFGETPTDTLPVHAVRLGPLALLSEPCELFCQFGLEIRRRSPSPMTVILGLTDGYHGYCPTMSAIQGGGYSGEPIYWARFPAGTGDRLVDAASRLLHLLW